MEIGKFSTIRQNICPRHSFRPIFATNVDKAKSQWIRKNRCIAHASLTEEEYTTLREAIKTEVEELAKTEKTRGAVFSRPASNN